MEESLFVYLIGSPDVSVPPSNYGGIELILGPFAEALAARGHKVTLFAGPGSNVPGVRCMSLLPHHAVLTDRQIFTREIAHAELARQVILKKVTNDPERQRKTIVHYHTDATLPMGYIPCVVTAHNGPRLSLPLYFQDCEERVLPLPTIVGISAANVIECAAAGLPMTAGYIYSDVPVSPIIEAASPIKGGFRGCDRYVAFLGRFDESKGCGNAIKWTLAYNKGKPEEEKLKLLIAAKDPDNEEARSYFDDRVAPHLGESVQYIGPIGGQDKIDFLSRAIALLFPIEWEEPFGLVPIEAMAAGTPVIAKARGAVKETVINGRTGFWVYSTHEAVEAIKKVVAGEILRDNCQSQARQFESGMVESYEQLYQQLLATDA